MMGEWGKALNFKLPNHSAQGILQPVENPTYWTYAIEMYYLPVCCLYLHSTYYKTLYLVMICYFLFWLVNSDPPYD